MPTTPLAPILDLKARYYRNDGVKLAAHKIFDDKEACMYEIGLKCLTEGYEYKVVKSCTKRDVTRVYRPKDIINDLNIDLNINVSYKRAWKGKQLALESNQGCPIASFARLPYYCYNLKLANENTITHIDTGDEGRFKMLFIGFGTAASYTLVSLVGQNNSLAEYMILSGADNRPPMLDKDLTKKYAELSATEKIKAACDLKATNIIIQDPGIVEGPVTQSVITHNAAYQADDLDAYDSDCDKISTAKAVLMANLFSYGSYVLSEVPIYDNTNIDMLNQSVQEMPYSEPSHFVEHPENEIHSDSNIISYFPYMIVSQNAADQDTNSSTQQDALILSVFEQLSNQEKEAKNIDTEIALEKKVKEMDNIVSKETNVISIADSEETLMLEEESRSKMLLQQSDPMNNTSVNQNEPSFDKLFELNNLKAELQEKDTTIEKLKTNIKRLNKTSTTNNVKKDIDETETINIELEHRVTKLIAKNKNLKQTYKQLYDSIKPSRMYKPDLVTLTPKDKNNRETHTYYLKHTMKQAAIFREIVEQAYSQNPLDSAIYSAYKYVKLIQELLGVNPSTSASGIKPSGNPKNDRIQRTPSSNEKNKVEVQSRKVKSSLNKCNFESKNVCNEHVKHSIKGSKALCSVCKECLFDANHAMCLIAYVNSMNMRAKSVSKKNKKRKEWKTTGIRYFSCFIFFFCYRLQAVQIVMWYLDSGCSKHMTGHRSQLTNSVHKFHGTDKFGNDQVATIMGYGDYQIGNIIISKVYYVEGLGHNLFSVGPGLQCMTLATPSSGLVPNPSSPASFIPPSRHEWDLVFQPVFDEFFSPPASVASPVPIEEALAPVESTVSPSSTTVDQDAPSLSSSQTTSQSQSQVIPFSAEEESHDLDVAHISNGPYFGIPIPETVSEESLSSDVISTIISQSPRGIFLNQLKYALESLKKYGIESCDPMDTPMVEKSQLNKGTQGKAVDPTHYRGMVGTFMYLTSSRPDLLYADSAIALIDFVDVDHVDCQDTRHSTSEKKRLEIGKCNGRLNPEKKKREPTFQVVLDALALTPFRMDKKKFGLNLEIFRDIFQICPRVHGQNFDVLPTDEDIVSFFKELGHTEEIKSITDVVVDQMHQPWITFATIINRSLSGKTTGIDKLCLSRAQILWAMYYKKNVDYIELLWEDFTYQIDNRAHKKDDYLFKKPASPKLSTVPASPEEPTRKSKRVKRLAKKSSNAPTAGVVIRETSVKSLSKKKEKMTVEKQKRIDLLFEVALTEEAQYEKVRKKSLRYFHKAHPSGSGIVTKITPSAAKIKPSVINEGTGAKPRVPNVTKKESTERSDQKRDSGDDNTKSDSEKGLDSEHETDENESGSESDQDENEEEIEDDEEEEEDEFAKTSSNDTDYEDETKIKDKTKGDEDEGMYYTANQFDNDVNVRLNEPVTTDERFIQKEGTNAEMTNVQQGNENSKIALNQVIEDAHVTLLTVPQKTKVLVTSSSHSSYLASKFLNFSNIPHTDAKIISPKDVHVHHEEPSNQTPTLLTATNPLSTLLNFTYVFQFNNRFTALEKEVVKLKRNDPLNTQVTALVDEHLDSRLGTTRDELMSYLTASITARITKQVKSQLPQILPKEVSNFAPLVIKSIFTESSQLKSTYEAAATLTEFELKKILIEKMDENKDKDEDHSDGLDRGLKKRKTNKDAEPKIGPKTKESKSSLSKGGKSQSKYSGKTIQSKQPEFEVTDSDMPQDQEENLGNDDEEPKRKVASKRDYWLMTLASSADKPLKTFDELMSTLIDFSAYIMNGIKITNLTQETLLGPAFKLLKGTRSNYAELKYDFEECYKALSKKLDWENPKGSDYPFDFTKPLPLVMNRNRQMVPVEYFFNNDLKYLQGGISTMTYTTSITKTKAVQYDLPGIKDMTFYGYARGLESTHYVYSTKLILAVTQVEVMQKHEYWYLREIEVRRADNDLYTFKEGDFPRHCINDIEDMIILIFQNRITNLSGDDVFDFAILL
uniref:Transposase, MuDR, MULE transposase domain protein n=1 Tax=Tanacetum cinerariifolium TaxID=118510 RepID=A0A6L2J6A3_TANCI|nr:transposase, MuDR, MULE transposase domain protein [Tanacetum cinerariifolium]